MACNYRLTTACAHNKKVMTVSALVYFAPELSLALLAEKQASAKIGIGEIWE
jgi:hypothetical protein